MWKTLALDKIILLASLGIKIVLKLRGKGQSEILNWNYWGKNAWKIPFLASQPPSPLLPLLFVVTSKCKVIVIKLT